MKADPWLMQEDVEARLNAPGSWLKGFVPIYEVRRSYIEDFIWQFHPVRSGFVPSALEEPGWPETFSMVPFQVVRTGERDFLSGKVRKILKVHHSRRLYCTEDEQIIARYTNHGVGFERIERVDIRMEALVDIMRSAKRVNGLWFLRSYRFSERSLTEMGLRESTGPSERGDSFVARRRVFRVLHDVPGGRERMMSGTVVTGRFLWTPKSGRNRVLLG